jgi:hypothetical protein
MFDVLGFLASLGCHKVARKTVSGFTSMSLSASLFLFCWSEIQPSPRHGQDVPEGPGGFLDEKTGRRLRDEVYGVGHTRDVAESVEKFLDRPRSQVPGLEYVGIKKNQATSDPGLGRFYAIPAPPRGFSGPSP